MDKKLSSKTSILLVILVVSLFFVGVYRTAQLPRHLVQQVSFPDIIQKSAEGVVHISCPQWQGSGFVVSEHLIVTARHVVDGVKDFEITLNNGEKLHAIKAISSKKYDVGFIWIDDFTCKLPVLEHGRDFYGTFFGFNHKVTMPSPLKLAGIEGCRLGQQVYILGSPYGKMNFNAVSLGIISGLNRDWDSIDPWTGEKYGWEIAFTSDSAAHPGNSGCPVFTMDGKVRGILVGGFSPVLNCSIPCDLFISDINKIELMFAMDEYEFEKAPKYSNYGPYYNHEEDNEYY